APLLEQRHVLRLAMPLWGASGASEPGRTFHWSPASEGAIRPPSGALGPQIYDFPCSFWPFALFAFPFRGSSRSRAFQDRHRAALHARVATRRLRRGAAVRGPLHRALLL